METALKTVSILLRKDWFDCLRSNTELGSVADRCLQRAVDMHGVLRDKRTDYCVQCTGEEIKAVLELALAHCNDAVAEIKDGIRRFGG
jgi:hypothetical protein